MKRRTAFLLAVVAAVLSSVLTSCGEAASAPPRDREPVFTKFSTYDFQMGRIVCIYIPPENNWGTASGSGTANGTLSCVTDGGS